MSAMVSRRARGWALAWGGCGFGQFGNKAGREPKEPLISRTSAVAAGNTHSIALRPDGRTWAWPMRRGRTGPMVSDQGIENDISMQEKMP